MSWVASQPSALSKSSTSATATACRSGKPPTARRSFTSRWRDQIVPIEPVVNIVNEIHGKLPIAVASGGHRRIVTRTLSCLGILDKFDTVICAEDYRQGKPHPDPFLTAAYRLGVMPEKCLVFEDTKAGIEAAHAAGMQWVLVPPPPRIRICQPE